MLVHLKPRRKSKQHEIMQNYVQTTNWHYGTSNAIHCKKNIVTSKLQRILTNRVSANGQSLSPKHPNPEFIDLPRSEDPKSLRLKQKEQKQQEGRKKKQKQKNSNKIQLATAYKKTFKYNTTMYQILKNVCKKSQCRSKKETFHDQKNANHLCSFKFQECDQSQSPTHQQGRESIYFLTKSGEKLRMLQNLKKKCTTLEVEEAKGNEVGKKNNLSFQRDQKSRSMIKTTLFEWKSLKPHHTKLHWRKESQFKNALKQSVCMCPKSFSNIQALQSSMDVDLIIEENPIDCLFYSCGEGKQISTSKPHSERTQFFQPNSLKQIKKFQTIKQSRKTTFESEPNQSFLRKNKFSLKHTEIPNTEFSVEAWNTKDRERQWDQLQNFAG